MKAYGVYCDRVTHLEGYMFPRIEKDVLLARFTYRKDATKWMKAHRFTPGAQNVKIKEIVE